MADYLAPAQEMGVRFPPCPYGIQMTKRIIKTDKAPAAIGPYSQAILHNSKYILELSGQIGINPQTGKMVEGGLEPQTEQVMDNIKAILESVGWTFENIIKTRIYLMEMNQYAKVNGIYAKRFNRDPPARATFAVKELPANALIEIECCCWRRCYYKSLTFPKS